MMAAAPQFEKIGRGDFGIVHIGAAGFEVASDDATDSIGAVGHDVTLHLLGKFASFADNNAKKGDVVMGEKRPAELFADNLQTAFQRQVIDIQRLHRRDEILVDVLRNGEKKTLLAAKLRIKRRQRPACLAHDVIDARGFIALFQKDFASGLQEGVSARHAAILRARACGRFAHRSQYVLPSSDV